MKKPYLFSIPNLITLIILGLALFRASYFKASKSFGSDSYNDWYYELFCVRNVDVARALADQVQCSDIANFASGIVFGLGKFTQDFKNDYKSLGLIHLIVASGTQVNYLFSSVEWILIQLGIHKKIRYVFFVLSCLGLFLLIGFTPPLIRASIFIGIIVTLTTFTGRYISALRALVYAMVIILIISPTMLYSLSLWLSCLASLAIILSAEFKNSYIPQPLQDNLFVTLLLLPILSQFNTNINLVTIPLNIILAIILPYMIGLLLLSFVPVVGILIRVISVYALSFIIGFISAVDDYTSQYLTIHVNKLYTQDIIVYYSFILLILIILHTYKTIQFNSRAEHTARLDQELLFEPQVTL
jgi:ComEC/Rec2-related protein